MTERYGWDQTPTPDLGLDITKAPADIQKLYKWIIEKMYGKDVASAYGQGIIAAGIIAKNAEAMSLFTSGKMDTLDTFVKDTLIELTNKDIISAPEIIMARNGEATLVDRLDRDFSLVNDKMVQTTLDVINGSVKVSVGESITTNGFYEFGNTYRYKALSVVAGDIFVDTNKGFEITRNGEIKISSTVKIVPSVTDEVHVGALGCNNSNDDICFQASLNLAKVRDCNVNVDVNVDVVGSVDIQRNEEHSFRRIIEISGRGVISKHTAGFLFTNTLQRNGGNIKFRDLHFRSTAGAGTVIFDGGAMLRIYFENCHFLNVDQFTKTTTTEGTNYLQTIYVSNSTVVGGEGWFIDARTGYDVSFTHSLVEHREAFAKIGACHSVRITDNVIEGISGKVLEVISGRSLVFEDNYMELNGTDIVGSAITIDNPAFSYGFPEMMNFSFQNNLYVASDIQVNNYNYHYIQITNYLKSITIKNNFCDCNLLKVVNRHTLAIQPSKLIEIYENNVINAKHATHDIPSPKVVTIGSGNVITAFRRPMNLSSFKFFNDAINNEEIVSGSKIVTACQEGKVSDKVGFVIEGVVLEDNTQYAIGISATMRDLQNEADGVKVVLRDTTTQKTLWEDTMNIKDTQLTTAYMTFYNLRPFLVTGGAKTVDVEISINPRSGSFVTANSQGLSVSNFVIQRGYVATDSIG